MSQFYLDSSAAVKLLVHEEHSRALAYFYDDHEGSSWVSSGLLRVEVMRAVTRLRPAAVTRARQLLLAFDYLALDDDVLRAAEGEPDGLLRSLDAIHLASARLLVGDLEALVTYDKRLAAAAGAAGITVLAPGTTPQRGRP